MCAPAVGLLHHRFGHEAPDPAAAHQNHALDGHPRPSGDHEHLVQRVLGGYQVQLVAGLHARVAARHEELLSARDPRHHELGVQRLLDVGDALACEQGAVVHQEVAHLQVGVLEGHYVAGGALLHRLDDRPRRLDLGIDEVVHLQKRVLREVGVGVLRVAHPRDLARHPELARHQAAGDDVELVAVGDADEEVRVVDAGLAQRRQAVAGVVDHHAVEVVHGVLGRLRVALDEDHVLVVGHQVARHLEAGGTGAGDDYLLSHRRQYGRCAGCWQLPANSAALAFFTAP